METNLRHPGVKWITAAFGAVAGIHILSAATVDRILAYNEIEYRSNNIPKALDGYTAAFLTDIHNYPAQKLIRMVRRVNARKPDLVLLGGDFSRTRLVSTMDILSGIRALDGIYGVAGNHDNPARLSHAMKKRGMVLLQNNGLAVRDGLYLAGVADLRHRRPNVKAALAGANREEFVLLLSHRPDICMLQDVSGTDLMLSGHTHGGEISFLGIWAPAMPLESDYGQKFVSGWCKSAAGTDIFVSRGIGHHLFRMFARPQVIFLTLRSAKK